MSDTPVIVDWIKRLEQRVADLEAQIVRLTEIVVHLDQPTTVPLAAASLEHPEKLRAGLMSAG